MKMIHDEEAAVDRFVGLLKRHVVDVASGTDENPYSCCHEIGSRFLEILSGRDKDFPKTSLYMSVHPEDKDFEIGNGMCWTDGEVPLPEDLWSTFRNGKDLLLDPEKIMDLCPPSGRDPTRSMTADEMGAGVMRHMSALISYWSQTGQNRDEVCDGMAFSLLVMADGGAMAINGLVIVSDAEGEAFSLEASGLHDVWHRTPPLAPENQPDMPPPALH